MLEQGHQIELVTQREKKNLEIYQLQDELKFATERFEKLLEETKNASTTSFSQLKMQEDALR